MRAINSFLFPQNEAYMSQETNPNSMLKDCRWLQAKIKKARNLLEAFFQFFLSEVYYLSHNMIFHDTFSMQLKERYSEN